MKELKSSLLRKSCHPMHCEYAALPILSHYRKDLY